MGIKESMSKEEQINRAFSQIHLTSVAIYPEKEDAFAIFDFTMSPEVTQYVFVVQTDSSGQINEEVYIES